MNKKETIILPLNQLHPHPQNPRKDLGDLSELTDSIRKNGVLQNLSVIPSGKDSYTVIIGHRRCEAAKLAGLTEVPCTIIENMTEQEQFSVMMEENMQRNDLTIPEQAYGFQYMLDIGMTKDEIVEKTGFSKGTVDRRLELAKLKPKNLDKVLREDGEFQLSLSDLCKLNQIDDTKERNRILDAATSRQDFIWKINSWLTNKKIDENIKKCEEWVKKAGITKANKGVENERYSGKWDTVKELQLGEDISDKLTIAKITPDMRWTIWYRSFVIIVPHKKTKNTKSKAELEREALNLRINKLKGIGRNIKAKCKTAAKSIFAGELKLERMDNEEITLRLWRILIQSSAFISAYNLRSLLEIETDEKLFTEISNTAAWKTMLPAVVESAKYDLVYYDGKYNKSAADILFDLLSLLKHCGLTLDEEEESYLCGTHDNFVKDKTAV